MPAPNTDDASTSPGMAFMFRAAGILVLPIGAILFLAPTRTASYFPWHVDPPITAAFLGANYLAASVLQLWAARQPRWRDARVAFTGVYLFTLATACLSALGIRRFSWHGPTLALISSASWCVVYFLVPPIWAWLWFKQPRNPTTRPDTRSQPPKPAVILLAICGAVLLVAAGLVFLPNAWPWDLSTPGSAYAGSLGMEPYIAAWLLGLGIVAIMASMHADPARLAGVWNAAIVIAVLDGIVLIRFRGSVEWSRPGSWIMCGVLLTLTAAGLLARAARPARRKDPTTEASRSR